MEIQSGHSELSIILQVSAIEGCPLSGVPLYYVINRCTLAVAAPILLRALVTSLVAINCTSLKHVQAILKNFAQ